MLAAGAVLAGCGSDSSSGASATDEVAAPLSKAEFVKQASAICEQGLKKKDAAVSVALKEQAEQAQSAPTAQETAKLIEETVLPAYSKTVDQLSQLGAPKADEAEIEKMMGEFEAAVKTLEADPTKANENNPFTSADKAAEAYGIKGCSL